MRGEGLNRRDFHKLSAAALGGLIAGAAGCEESKPTGTGAKPAAESGSQAGQKPSGDTKPKSDAAKPADAPKSADAAATAVAMHACRGLNECKEQGKDHKNGCAGQGSCYTVTHTCAGQNDCKYQGGCGGEHALNDCKTKGGCGHFPIEGKAWTKAREGFEARMQKAGKKVGKAPEASKA